MRRTLYRSSPVVLLVVFFVMAGCGSLPTVPTIDQIRAVPDMSQSTLLGQNQFEPLQGPIGTILTVHGHGVVFPAGYVHFQFSGTGAVDFNQEQPTADLKVQVPFGAASGPFGFSIAARAFQELNNSLPSSNVFQAWRIGEPGFRVTQDTGIPANLISPPPNKH